MKEKSDVKNNAMTFLRGRKTVYIEQWIVPLPSQPIVLAEPKKSEHPTSSELSSAEHSSGYYKYISPEDEISGRGFQI